MKLSSLLLGSLFAIVVFVVVLLFVGGEFHQPLSGSGAALYNPANEVLVKGSVQEVEEFACPVGDNELGSHLMLKTDDGVVRIHLVQSRIMRSQHVSFAPGDQIEVAGAKLHFRGSDDVIAREILRGNETLVFRDHEGKLMMVQ